MTLRDFRETATWAVATTVLVAGAFGSRAVQSADRSRPMPPSATISGCKLTAETKRSATPFNVAVVVRAQNPVTDVKRFDISLAVVRRDFTGSAGSRVFNPKDFKQTTERTQTLHFAADGQKTSVKTILVPIDARRAKDRPGSMASYEVQLIQKKPVPLTWFPAMMAWRQK
jgi:hypothetical protein